jgi:hypothetical protein
MLLATSQHRVLQVKWLRYMFDHQLQGSCRGMLLHHMALISGDPTFPFTSLICPEIRRGPWYTKPSILSYMHEAFDHFHFTIDHSNILLATLLHFPLRYMFSSYSDDHWINRHKTLPASTIFIYDPMSYQDLMSKG